MVKRDNVYLLLMMMMMEVRGKEKSLWISYPTKLTADITRSSKGCKSNKRSGPNDFD